MTSVLIWGFYHQGNLGDDLMGMMLYEMFEELGAEPVIFTPNPRFVAMGYRTIENFADADPDLVVLGGGAFFKTSAVSKQPIEQNLEDLGAFIRERDVPVHGVSLGSDGTSTLGAMSPARKSIVLGENFKSVVVRLAADQKLGLKNSKYLCDIVMLTALCSRRYARLTPIEPDQEAPRTLINLSRRSAPHLLPILWRERKNRIAFFRAHTGKGYETGEVAVPGYETISDDRLPAQLGYLAAADRIISAKLHPGVVALSYGTRFESVYPRPKTAAFLREMRDNPPDPESLFDDYMQHLRELIQ